MKQEKILFSFYITFFDMYILICCTPSFTTIPAQILLLLLLKHTTTTRQSAAKRATRAVLHVGHDNDNRKAAHRQHHQMNKRVH